MAGGREGEAPKEYSAGQLHILSHFACGGLDAHSKRGEAENKEYRAAPSLSVVIHSLPICVYYFFLLPKTTHCCN